MHIYAGATPLFFIFIPFCQRGGFCRLIRNVCRERAFCDAKRQEGGGKAKCKDAEKAVGVALGAMENNRRGRGQWGKYMCRKEEMRMEMGKSGVDLCARWQKPGVCHNNVLERM